MVLLPFLCCSLCFSFCCYSCLVFFAQIIYQFQVVSPFCDYFFRNRSYRKYIPRSWSPQSTSDGNVWGRREPSPSPDCVRLELLYLATEMVKIRCICYSDKITKKASHKFVSNQLEFKTNNVVDNFASNVQKSVSFTRYWFVYKIKTRMLSVENKLSAFNAVS